MIKIKKKLLKFYDKRMFQDLMSDEELVSTTILIIWLIFLCHALSISLAIVKFYWRQLNPKERMMRFFDFVLEIENL